MTNRIFMILSGIILIVGGVMAIFLPVAASLTATLIVGWTFAIAGIFHIIGAVRNAEDRLWHGAFGLLGVGLGLSFVLFPGAGMVSLTLLLGALFAGSAAMQFYLAWKRRQNDNVWMMALSGLLSAVIAVLIALNPFAAAATIPGLFLAIELISTGVALLMLRPRKEAHGLEGEATT